MRCGVSLDNEPVHFLIRLVSGNDDLVTGLQSVDHLDELRIAAAETDGALDRGQPIGQEDKCPVAARVLIERTIRDHQGRGCTAHLHFQVDGLAHMNAGRRRRVKIKIDLERAVDDLGIDLGDPGFVVDHSP